MKYFYRKHGYLTKTIEAWKVYDKMPDDMPEVFKKSKLVCFDSIKLECSMSGLAKIVVYNHAMTGTKEMEKYLLESIEISEEKFNDLYNRCTELKNEIKQVIEDEDSM